MHKNQGFLDSDFAGPLIAPQLPIVDITFRQDSVSFGMDHKSSPHFARFTQGRETQELFALSRIGGSPKRNGDAPTSDLCLRIVSGHESLEVAEVAAFVKTRYGKCRAAIAQALIVIGGKKNDRKIGRETLDPFEGFQTARSWHVNVENGQIGQFGTIRLNRFDAVTRDNNAVALIFKTCPAIFANMLVVVCKEYRFHARSLWNRWFLLRRCLPAVEPDYQGGVQPRLKTLPFYWSVFPQQKPKGSSRGTGIWVHASMMPRTW